MFRELSLGLAFGLISVPCLAQSAAPATPFPADTTEPVAQTSTHSNAQPAALPVNLLGEAHDFYRKRNFEAAISRYREYVKAHPNAPDGYAGLVRVYLKQKNVDLAAQTAEQGLKQSDSPRMHVAQGEVLFRQGRISAAEAEWVKVINSGYPEARAYLGVARVRRALAMYKAEKDLLDRAQQLDPDDPDISDEWIDTLSRVERIAYLESALSGDNNWDANKRGDIANYLQYLKERAKQKSRSSCRLVSKVMGKEGRRS